MSDPVTWVTIISAVLGAGSAVYSATQTPASADEPIVSTTDSGDLDDAASAAAKAEAARIRKRKGYADTVLTSTSGLTNPASTLKQTLG